MMEKKEIKNEYIIIILKPIKNNEERVRIFGEKFVKNNKNKCHIEYNGKKYELKEYFEDIDNNYNHKNEIILILAGINNITNMSYLFYSCDKLSSILIFSGNDLFKYFKYIDGINPLISPCTCTYNKKTLPE